METNNLNVEAQTTLPSQKPVDNMEKEKKTKEKPKKKGAALSIIAILLAVLGLIISFFEFACINLPSIIDCAFYALADLGITGILIIYFGGLIRDIVLLVIGILGFVVSLASLVLNAKNKNYIVTVVGIIATIIGIIGVTQCITGIVHHIIPDMIEFVSAIMRGQYFLY